MRWLEHRIPPPLVFALIGVAMWLVRGVTVRIPMDALARGSVAGLLALVGIALGVAGAMAFRRAHTTIDPHRPEQASSLVVDGIYRATRNPMYLGLAAILLAWAVYLAAPVAFDGPLLFVLYITRFQIVPEERTLAAKFGPAYAAYRQRVRRWL
jgi:protein-S-isoprenylcysteine O-methyltransferase Ste14